MKRFLCLLLCFLMLFCCACKKENPALKNEEPASNNEEPELGTLYTSAGNTYNTHVRMRLLNEKLTPPVKSLTIEIQNDTDYRANLLGKIIEWECEKWENGEWISQPVGVTRDDARTDSVLPKSKKTWTISYAGDLKEGLYRLQRMVYVNPIGNLPDPNKKDFECMIEVYFTIAPGATS